MPKKTNKLLDKKLKTKILLRENPRKLKKATYKSFRLQKRIRPAQPPIPTVRRLTVSAFEILRRNWRVFTWISIIYIMLSLLIGGALYQGIDLQGVKESAKNIFAGQWSDLFTAGLLLTTLLSGSGGTNTGVNDYLAILLLCFILAVVWALRQILAKKSFKAREAYYRGLYPLAPFVLVLMVFTIQLIPFGIGAWLYATVITKVIAATIIEKTLWFLLLLMLLTLSLYMACSSLFALLIVALPDMTPMRALRSARQLVLHRRWIVLRKLIALPLIILILGVLIMLPILVWATAFAQASYFVLSVFGWQLAIAYVYVLYRSLLNE